MLDPPPPAPIVFTMNAIHAVADYKLFKIQGLLVFLIFFIQSLLLELL